MRSYSHLQLSLLQLEQECQLQCCYIQVRLRYRQILLCMLLSGSYAPGIEIKCVAVDFTDGFDIYSKIETELESLDIAVLGKQCFALC
jgi:hypothetical protein